MKYQGPESFRRLVEESYEKIKTFFSRDGSPHIIVGGIGKIYNDGQETITEGDAETNSRIDQCIRAMSQTRQDNQPQSDVLPALKCGASDEVA